MEKTKGLPLSVRAALYRTISEIAVWYPTYHRQALIPVRTFALNYGSDLSNQHVSEVVNYLRGWKGVYTPLLLILILGGLGGLYSLGSSIFIKTFLVASGRLGQPWPHVTGMQGRPPSSHRQEAKAMASRSLECRRCHSTNVAVLLASTAVRAHDANCRQWRIIG